MFLLTLLIKTYKIITLLINSKQGFLMFNLDYKNILLIASLLFITACGSKEERINQSISSNIVFKDQYNNCISLFEINRDTKKSYSIHGDIIDPKFCENNLIYSKKQNKIIKEFKLNIFSYKDNNQLCWISSHINSTNSTKLASFASNIDCSIHRKIQSSISKSIG